ncbi:MAG: polysaccharide deacetylase family protein, partial [Gammaproteobacteria bacterium]
LLQGAGAHGPITLMYHSVTPGSGTPDWLWAVSFRRFTEQLDLLREGGWKTVCVRDLMDGASLPPRTVAITFDDGYADNYPAFEALAERGMRATWFIVTRDVGKSSSWRDPGAPVLPMLSAEQLRVMAGAGMEIGTHSRSHCRLTEVDDATLHDEVRSSKTELAGMLGKAVESFAYPYGKHDDRVVGAVEAAGYRAACVTRSGWALHNHDLMRIRRVSVFAHDGLSAFARKLAFADNDVSWRHLARYSAERILARIGI